MERRLRKKTSLDTSGAKRDRLLEILLDERNSHLSNRQISRMVLVDEKMVRRHRASLGLKSPEPYTRAESEKKKKPTRKAATGSAQRSATAPKKPKLAVKTKHTSK